VLLHHVTRDSAGHQTHEGRTFHVVTRRYVLGLWSHGSGKIFLMQTQQDALARGEGFLDILGTVSA
jgi:hypothetical protein